VALRVRVTFCACGARLLSRTRMRRWCSERCRARAAALTAAGAPGWVFHAVGWKWCRSCRCALSVAEFATRATVGVCRGCDHYREHRNRRGTLTREEYDWNRVLADAHRWAAEGEFWCVRCQHYRRISERVGRRSVCRLGKRDERARYAARAGRTFSPRPFAPLDAATLRRRWGGSWWKRAWWFRDAAPAWLREERVRVRVERRSEARRRELERRKDYRCIRKMAGGALVVFGGIRRAPPEIVATLRLLRAYHKARYARRNQNVEVERV
jgi:hypothetical protein